MCVRIQGVAPGSPHGLEPFSESGKMEWKQSRAETDSRWGEEHCLVWALRQILGPRLRQEDEASFLSLLRDIFPQAASAQLRMEKKEKEAPLELTIREVMKEDRLMFIEHLQQKVGLLVFSRFSSSLSSSWSSL